MVMARWAKLLPGVLMLVVAGAFLAKPTVPFTVSSGGFSVDGRQCLYRVVDGRLEYLIVLDGEWLRGGDRATLGGTDFSFQRTDGRAFQMRSTAPGVLLIDEHEFHLRDGVIFLVTVHSDGNQCRQVPVSFEAADIPHLEVESHVRNRLERVVRDYAEVRLFLGRG